MLGLYFNKKEKKRERKNSWTGTTVFGEERKGVGGGGRYGGQMVIKEIKYKYFSMEKI